MAEHLGRRRGLVLGAGGVLGAAWAVGALVALEAVHGFDPRDADVIVGTSAGSVLASLLAAGVSARDLLDHQRGVPLREGPLAGFSWDYERATARRPGLPDFRFLGSGSLLRSGARRMRQMPPTAVLSAFLPRGSQSLDRVRHLVEAITPMDEWSSHPNVWICAMDYDTGRRVAFGREGAPKAALADAVMASCAIPAWFKPVRIDGSSYVDGGACSSTSVDLLAGLELDEVYVVAPMVSFAMDRPDHLLAKIERRWRVQVTKRCLREVEKVRTRGTDVTVIGPGPEDLAMIGANLMDVGRRIGVLETSVRTSLDALRDPDHVGPDHLAEVG